MTLKLWTPNEVLTSTDLNNLSKQTLITCTSGGRPSSPVEGMTIYETDTDRYAKWSGAAWEYWAGNRIAFTPTLTAVTTNPVLGTASNRQGWYAYLPGPSIIYNFFIAFGSSGVSAGSGNYGVSLPVTSATLWTGGHPAVGIGQLADVSTGAFKSVSLFVPHNSATLGLVADSPVAHNFPWTWAATDYLSGTVVYPI